MNNYNHVIISRCKFKDDNLLLEYMKISKHFFAPCLKSQTNKNFTLGLLINENHIELVKNELELDFVPFNDESEYIRYVIDNAICIQTRHDIDDWMSDDYVDTIQKCYIENIDTYDSFLIQSHPIKFTVATDKSELLHYTATNNSMHLTLCQKEVKYSIHAREHPKMFEIASHVISIPHGKTKWIIHGKNLSIMRRKSIINNQ